MRSKKIKSKNKKIKIKKGRGAEFQFWQKKGNSTK
jgi:hypothetical protein